MDSYKKLCEVGSCLYQARHHGLCIKVLDAAQKLQTNQKGITMKIQLTLANAYAATKQRDVALAHYQVIMLQKPLFLKSQNNQPEKILSDHFFFFL